jgi:hypothetical protein
MLLSQDANSKTPLELAIISMNPRCINLIMSMIAQGCGETLGKCTNLFEAHFAKLINYASFKEFMDASFYQSE